MALGFGVFAPQGWKTELGGLPSASAQWERCLSTALAAEAGGFDSVWVYDHVHPIPDPASPDPVFECWTTTAALAQATSTIRLGQMVGCIAYREPALLAKMAATVDVISGGRLDWGIGAGWYWHEFEAYGFPWGTPRERIGRLREGVEIVESMWTQERTDYEGEWYRCVDARCLPRPLQSPRPPIWVGGSGERLTLRVVARHADYSNFGGKPEEFAHKCGVLRRHCDEIERDHTTIVKSIHQDCIVGEDEADVQRKVDARMEKWGPVTGEPEDSYRRGHLVGTPDQVVDRIAEYAAVGAGYFVMWLPDFPSHSTLDLLVSDVLPRAREISPAG